MRRLISLVLALMLFMTGAALADTQTPGDIILVTEYRQMGWNDIVQVGCLDADGGLWYLFGSDAKLDWPYEMDEQIEYLKTCDQLEYAGEFNPIGLAIVKGLMEGLPDQYTGAQMAACDAGTETTYAVCKDGTEMIILGMSGDDLYENMDPAAQTLYEVTRILFPKVRSYAYYAGMGPAGFDKKTPAEYLGAAPEDVMTATITAWYNDCEEGGRLVELTADKEAYIRSLAAKGTVTGKANNTFVTGGTTTYVFTDDAGNTILRMEVYDDCLVMDDGMYFLQAAE